MVLAPGMLSLDNRDLEMDALVSLGSVCSDSGEVRCLQHCLSACAFQSTEQQQRC